MLDGVKLVLVILIQLLSLVWLIAIMELIGMEQFKNIYLFILYLIRIALLVH